MTERKLHPKDRADLHAAIDKWLDAVEARPLSLDDGEYHHIEVTASRADEDDDGQLIMSFMLKTTTEAEL
jgi:hypothetical protein